MNDTVYWDKLQMNLACKPDQLAEGYEFLCFYNNRILASLQLIAGFWCYHIAYLRMRNRIKPTLGGPSESMRRRISIALISAVTGAETSAERRASRALGMGIRKSERGASTHGIKQALVFGTTALTISMAWLVGGMGTVYDMDDKRGQICDFIALLYSFSNWYALGMQYQSAKYFKSLIELPEDARKTRGSASFKSSPATFVFDLTQTYLAPIGSIVVWILVVQQDLLRGWFYFAGFALNTLFGFRAFVAIAQYRICTLRKVAVLHTAAGGTVATRQRRQGIIKNKVLRIAIELTATFLNNCFLPGSLILMGSSFSSRQMVIHFSIISTPGVLALLMATAAMYSSTIKAGKNKKIQDATRDEMKRKAGEKRGVGLFTEAQTQVIATPLELPLRATGELLRCDTGELSRQITEEQPRRNTSELPRRGTDGLLRQGTDGQLRISTGGYGHRRVQIMP